MGTRSFLAKIGRERSGSAAAEMALVVPMLIVLIFGAFELGNYFLSEHIVTKAVRDGTRYAGRLSFNEYTGCAASGTAETNIRNLIRTGRLDGSGAVRLPNWTDPTTITVTVNCSATGYSGVYNGLALGTPVVTVTATVPYTSLFGLGFGAGQSGLNVSASAQGAVMGI